MYLDIHVLCYFFQNYIGYKLPLLSLTLFIMFFLKVVSRVCFLNGLTPVESEGLKFVGLPEPKHVSQNLRCSHPKPREVTGPGGSWEDKLFFSKMRIFQEVAFAGYQTGVYIYILYICLYDLHVLYIHISLVELQPSSWCLDLFWTFWAAFLYFFGRWDWLNTAFGSDQLSGRDVISG